MDRVNNCRRKINPIETAGILSRWTFFHTIRLFAKGYTSGLEIDDVYEVLPDCRSKILGEAIEQQWQKEVDKQNSPSVWRVLRILYGKTFLFIGLVQFVVTMVVTTWRPKAISKVISYFTPGQNNITKQDVIFYACLILGLNVVSLLILFNFRLMLSQLSIKARAAVSSLLYRKLLRIAPESLSHITVGKIITIITKDVDSIEIAMFSGISMWTAFCKTILICYLIYQQIGIASLFGIAFFLVVLPLQVLIGKATYHYKLNCSKKSDERLDLVREVLATIKIIKMYTWEQFFEQKIQDARKQELKELHKLFYSNVWITIIGNISSGMALFIFLMTYVWMSDNVTAETIFYIVSCFNDLEQSLSNEIPSGFSYFVQLYAVTKRIESVLTAQELPIKQQLVRSKDPKIVFNEVTASIHETTVLEHMSLTITKGLYIVVGETGSGKTTLLKTILQECHTTGKAEVCGTISYASQEPWLFPSTIKNNILFGENYHEVRYHKVLKICNLEYDLDLLVEGDNTVIGESGINLSKGQQARVNLARALYKNSDIYLIDDCLASLDAQVSNDIFRESFCNFLKNKLCIFVTNNIDYGPRADRVIVINSGSVEFRNKIDHSQIASSSVGYKKSISEQNNIETEETSQSRSVYHETKKSGKVPLRCYVSYIKHGSVVVFIFVVALFAFTHFTASYSEKVFSQWVTLEQNITYYRQLNDTNTSEYKRIYEERTHKLVLYSIAIVTFIILSLIKSFTFFYFVRTTSNSLHKAMVKNILNSTMKFFDSHFIGNVINRFTVDYATLDDTLPFSMMECLTMIFTAFGGVVIVTTVNYIFLLESLLLIVVLCVVKQFCQPAGRNMERIFILARNPINGHLNATLEGLSTIRVNSAEKLVTHEYDRHQDLSNSAHFMMVTNFVSLFFFLRSICILFTGIIIFQFLLTDISNTVGDVGLVITQSFVITNIITLAIILVADCENLMISVERILEYTELEEEKSEGKILLGWPKRGSINFKNVSLKYGNKEMLTDINFSVSSKQKLGIVGRTGAGKSSIISSLFRLYPTEGEITIDGVDIRDVCLTWLRSNITAIPQDPYLFSGTIRENLDPLKQYSDKQIWRILKELPLSNLIYDLGASVDKGSTFSAGQKQMLCLARAILRRNRIIILDEATANVDQKTEILMQEIIHKYSAECTMLVVAHNALPVKECHKIIVLEKGQIKEIIEIEK